MAALKHQGRLLLLNILWLSLTNASNMCTTTHHSDYSDANCSSLNYEYIPWALHQDIQLLDMSHNTLAVLVENSFMKYSPLRKLLLGNNKISKIEDGAFNKLSNLQYLDLSGNLLKSVPTDALQNMPDLVQLYLSGNSITHIENNAFLGLPSLKLLHLEGNYLRYIQPNAFIGLNMLQNLELQNNAIQSLEDGLFQYFDFHLMTIRLYNNPWFCDCRIRWLKIWLTNMTDLYKIRWQFPSLEPKCDGPSLVRDKKFSDVSEDYFACPVEMYTSGSQLTIKPNEDVRMYCKYFSVPESGAVWYKNNKKMNIFKNDDKYSVSEVGSFTKDSVLEIKDFQYEDIGFYKCMVQNILGSSSISYTVTLEGVDPSSITPAAALSNDAAEASVDVKSIIIAVSVIGGLLLIMLIVGVIVCGTGRWRRHQQQQKQQIALQVKEHFITNGDVSMSKSIDNSDNADSHSNDSNHNKDKVSTPDPDESAMLSTSVSNIYHNPTSPNGNTYISFGSELSDPEDINHMYSTFQSQRPPGSHTESTTPLLDNNTSSFFESGDPFNDSQRMYSLSHTPQRPTNYYISNGHIPRTPVSARSTPMYRDPHRDYQDYEDYRDPNYGDYQDYEDYEEYCDPKMERFNRDYQDPRTERFNRDYQDPRTERFNRDYQNPRTECFNRDYQDPRTERFNRDYQDPRTINRDYQDPRTERFNRDYQDYRELQYPNTRTMPNPQRVLNTKKSVSVGNLQYNTAGPRKPPRVSKSREHVLGSECDTSSEIERVLEQADKPSYVVDRPGFLGITPGTPV